MESLDLHTKLLEEIIDKLNMIPELQRKEPEEEMSLEGDPEGKDVAVEIMKVKKDKPMMADMESEGMEEEGSDEMGSMDDKKKMMKKMMGY